MIDASRPETWKFSDEAYERYLKKDERIKSSAARADKSKSLFQAMIENREEYLKMTTADGYNVHELIKNL